jgi:magnesium chelatase accessory protein
MIASALRWDHEGRAWPHRDTSRFVRAGGLRWHVQQAGTGPVALLIHGTGASTHSWCGLMPLLARRWTVVAMDLPGHGFTDTPPGAALSLPGIAKSLAALVEVLGLDVARIVGHSAGAAIGARMVIDATVAPTTLTAINGALLPLAGVPGWLFPPVARLMAATPLATRIFARRRWDRAAVDRLIRGTGSSLDAQGLDLYGVLLRDAQHAAGALGMMARWDLAPLARDLARLRTPVELIVGAGDRAVPPRDAWRVQALLPRQTESRIHVLHDAGHLVHEEQPHAVVGVLLEAADARRSATS